MSRIGKEPATLAEGVTVAFAGQTITVKGALGELSHTLHEGISAEVNEGNIFVSCADDKAFGAFAFARFRISQGVCHSCWIDGHR